MNKGTIGVSIIMPKDRHQELQKAAAKNGMSLAAYFRQAAYEKLAKEAGK